MTRRLEQLSLAEMGRVKSIHFVGVGGSGMSGIAEVLVNQGFEISGSDLAESKVTQRLQSLGVKVFLGHREAHVECRDVVVVSSAVDDANPEIRAAKEKRIPVIRRAEMLGELMRYRFGIAVAGTHGKTTTTSIVASLFGAADKDPTFIIGGLLKGVQSNAKLGSGRYLIAEADESDASFVHLLPMITVLTNVDRDHLVNYDGSFSKLREAFLGFIHNLPFYGLLIACVDDPIVASMIPQITRPIITYGFSENADVRAERWRQVETTSFFDVVVQATGDRFPVQISMPGRHNVLNALAAAAVAIDQELEQSAIQLGLAEFSGVGRRFEVLGRCYADGSHFMLVDDYGHHPSEVRATIDAARASWPDRRVVMVYQPHRYSRTSELFDQFVEVLKSVDVLLLTEVYPAGEMPIPGSTGFDLYERLRLEMGERAHWAESVAVARDHIASIIENNDILLTQGAGETATLAAELQARYHFKEPQVELVERGGA